MRSEFITGPCRLVPLSPFPFDENCREPKMAVSTGRANCGSLLGSSFDQSQPSFRTTSRSPRWALNYLCNAGTMCWRSRSTMISAKNRNGALDQSHHSAPGRSVDNVKSETGFLGVHFRTGLVRARYLKKTSLTTRSLAS